MQDFTSLLDEIDDNIDMYGSHKTDMRKGLKLVIEADSEWQLQLRQLKEQSPPEELDQYSFVLTNASRGGQGQRRQCPPGASGAERTGRRQEADQDLFGKA